MYATLDGSKDGSSRTYYRLFSCLSGMELQPGEADCRLLDRPSTICYRSTSNACKRLSPFDFSRTDRGAHHRPAQQPEFPIRGLLYLFSARFSVSVEVPGGIVRPGGLSRLLGASAPRGCWALAGMAWTKKAGGGRLDSPRPLQIQWSGSLYELTCHPGRPPEEPDLRALDYRHAAELQVLTSSSVHAENAARHF